MNKRVFSRIIAIMLVITLGFANISLLGNAKTYATELNLDGQSVLTSNANVEFDAYYVDKSGKTTHAIKQDINSNDLQMCLYIKATKGYLKDIKVKMFGEDENRNANFKISNKAKEISSIDSIDLDTNTVKIKQVDKDVQVLVKIPIYANRDDIFDVTNLNKQNSIKIIATYVKDDGKEETIAKTIKTNIEWTAKIKTMIEQEVVKNINLLENKGIMLQTIVRTGLENNNLPIKETRNKHKSSNDRRYKTTKSNSNSKSN